jgi:hypothetical protein
MDRSIDQSQALSSSVLTKQGGTENRWMSSKMLANVVNLAKNSKWLIANGLGKTFS